VCPELFILSQDKRQTKERQDMEEQECMFRYNGGLENGEG
jgi:hypothetical protein